MIQSRWIVAATCCVSVSAFSCGSEKQTPPTVSAQTNPSVPSVEVVKVVEQKLNITVKLPGELSPYEAVDIYPKVTGFVRWLGVDRGSHAKKGELIARLEAPEITAQLAEAQSKFAAAQAQVTAAAAKLAADHSTYEKLAAAAKTPGVVAQNDLVIAQQAEQADQANEHAARSAAQAAQSSLQAAKQVELYMDIAAPFDGVVTERNVHPGALVGPAAGPGAGVPMLRMETIARLRLTVAVPETQISAISPGALVEFTAPAFPGESFRAPIARIAHSVDLKTRTMPVEMDVTNSGGRLSSGSFCEVLWPVRRSSLTLFVPASAIATNLERTFVIRINANKTEWVDVKPGATSGSLTEVFGPLHAGDEVAQRATDALRAGTQVTPRLVSSN